MENGRGNINDEQVPMITFKLEIAMKIGRNIFLYQFDQSVCNLLSHFTHPGGAGVMGRGITLKENRFCFK